MKKVKWNPTSKLASDVLASPKPASLYQPEWYKKYPAFDTPKPVFNKGSANKTIKHCVPFADAINAGYILETWQEIRFEKMIDGSVQYHYPTDPAIISHRDKPSIDMGEDYHPVEFTINPPWAPELPEGWSMLYTHPMNRPELPFFVPSGIIDCDKYVATASRASLPFYLKKSFSGTLPIGTPIVQMIPIKRESWSGSAMEYNEKKQSQIVFNARKRFWGGYKKFAWSKKSYK